MKICIYKINFERKFKQSNCLNVNLTIQHYDILKAQSENYSILIIKSYARNGFSDLILNLFLLSFTPLYNPFFSILLVLPGL